MRTIVEAARTMLYSKKLSKNLWAEAVNTVVYVLNRTGNSGQEGKTPYELWYNKTPNISHLKLFGSEVYVHIPKEKRRKWDQKGRKGIFVGYSEETKGYRICFDGREVSLSRDVIFKEATEIEIKNEKEKEETTSEMVAESEENNSGDEENVEGEQNLDELNQSTDQTRELPKMRLRDRQNIEKPIRYRAETYYSKSHDPVTYEEAMTQQNSKNWKEAMDEEMSSLKKNVTWKLVDLRFTSK